MTLTKAAIIQYADFKSCFVRIPQNWTHGLNYEEEPVVFEVCHGQNQRSYLQWAGDVIPSSGNHAVHNKDTLQINKICAAKLDLKENEEVSVQHLQCKIQHCQKVYLEPEEVDDWEIMELNANVIEKELLNQICVVWKSQVFPFWVQKHVTILVKVSKSTPGTVPVLLVNDSEVLISPKPRAKKIEKQKLSLPSLNDSLDSISRTTATQSRERRKLTLPLDNSTHKQVTKAQSINSLNYKASDIDFGLTEGQNFTFFNILSRYLHQVFSSTPQEDNAQVSMLNKAPSELVSTPVSLKLRVLPLHSGIDIFFYPKALQATTVFMNSRTLYTKGYPCDFPNTFLAKITKIPSPQTRQDLMQKNLAPDPILENSNKKPSKKDKQERSPKFEKILADSCIVRVVMLSTCTPEDENVPSKSLNINLDCLAVPDVLRRFLGLDVSISVFLESLHYEPVLFNSLSLHPVSNVPGITDKEVIDGFYGWIEKGCKYYPYLLISERTLVHLSLTKGGGTDYLLKFGPTTVTPMSSPTLENAASNKAASPKMNILQYQYGYISPKLLSNINIKLGDQISIKTPLLQNSLPVRKVHQLNLTAPGVKLEALGGIKDFGMKALSYLELWLGLRPSTHSLTWSADSGKALLICGSKGVGKTTLAKAICKELTEPPFYVHTHVLDCKNLRGKRVENISKQWELLCAEGIYRQPSVLLLDDFDIIASAPTTPEQEAGPDGLYFSKIAQAFIDILDGIHSVGAKLIIIATAKSCQSIHSSLMSTRGRHIFHTVIEIAPPNGDQREDILKALVRSKNHLSDKTLSVVSWPRLASRTEGYVAQDLDLLLDRATLAAWQRNDLNEASYDDEKSDVIIMDADFRVALKAFTPASLRGLQLHSKGQKRWKDVGGLEEIKQSLKEILLWPVKYPTLFANCPLRPLSGILLYGAPGTGKTLLAGVVAKECSMNFISIKGPELLSKYIGASEQAIRDVFQRAQSAKPCILFFDEFDSIAPRRGHDSTGVTDRVVNQLLTQLDGVETLQGVYVLAATSRPDLIDPALLRPGRLDRCLHCPLPNEMERLDILTTLSRHLTMGSDVKLGIIASETQDFSGADLQALLYNSQMDAFHESKSGYYDREKKMESFDEVDGNTKDVAHLFLKQNVCPENLTLNMEEKALQEIAVIKNNIFGLHTAEISSHRKRTYSNISLCIHQHHLLKSMATTRPSVSPEERLKYKMIFESFVSSRGGDFSALRISSKKRVTLA